MSLHTNRKQTTVGLPGKNTYWAYLGHGGLVRDSNHAHPPAEYSEDVDRVEAL